MKSTTPVSTGTPDETPKVHAHHFRFLLIAILLLLGLQLIARTYSGMAEATAFVGAIAMGLALFRTGIRSLGFWIGVPLLVLAVAGGGLLSDRDLSSLGGSPFHAPFFFFTASTVLIQVLRAKRVTEDTLFGTACAYLLISLAFASAYEAVEFFYPGSIAGVDATSLHSLFSQLTYFSLVTLTTLGYGDMAPVHPFCQSLAIVESVAGVMFPALVVARIIAIQATQDRPSTNSTEAEKLRETVISRILFIFLPTAVLLIPWIDDSPWSRPLAGFILFSLVVAGISFVSERRDVLVGGLGFAVISIILKILGGSYFDFAISIEVVVISAVVVRMAAWCFQRRAANVSVILTATSIYWLIGIAFSDAFYLLNSLHPGAIAHASGAPLTEPLYFSFMTLTTTGYGDFTPMIPIARSLAALESFVGIFFPAIVIAKLVSLYGERD